MAVHSFASDEIFQTLSRKYEQDLLSQAIMNYFNAGVASQVYGGASAGNLFEKSSIVVEASRWTDHHMEVIGTWFGCW